MTKQGTILIVDDNKGVLAAIDMLLSGTFKKVITISNPNRIPAMLETENIDVVLLDMNFSSGINNGNEGIFWLGEIRKISNDLPVVLFIAMQTSNSRKNSERRGYRLCRQTLG